MNSLLGELREVFSAALESAFAEHGRGIDPLIKHTADPALGDYQCNVAMSLAKRLGLTPREVADRLVEALSMLLQRGPAPFVLQVAGPGFINIRLKREYLESCLNATPPEQPSDRLGIATVPTGRRQTIVVDYSSPNVAKPMHVGHLRSTIIGDCLVRVLSFAGHEVTRQNHIGDWGTQFGMIILALWHLFALRRRGESTETFVRRTTELSNPLQRAATLAQIAAEHQAELDRDVDGREFYEFLRAQRFQYDELLPAYQYVNAVESAAEGSDLRIVDPRNGQAVPLASVSNHVVAMLQRGSDADEQELFAWRTAVQSSLRRCTEIYERLGVLLRDSDVRGESFYHDLLPGVAEELSAALAEPRAGDTGAIHAVCRVDHGALCIFFEKPDGTPAFKGPQGDSLPMIIRKSDGAYLYSTTDLAAALFRIAHPTRRPIPLRSAALAAELSAKGGGLGADRVAYVVGAPQKLHFEMLFSALRALGWADGVRLEHVMFGSVLGEDRKMLRTRSGDSVLLVDLLDEAERRARALVDENEPKRAEMGLDPLSEDHKRRIAHAVGVGAVKYADLSQNRSSDYVFSWPKMLAMQGNTAPYLMYAYARLRSIARKAGTDSHAAVDAAPIRLSHPAEVALGLKILQLPETLDAVGESLLPHLLCEYLYELSARLMAFYEHCPVLKAENAEVRASRERLCGLTARALRIGLELLGIDVLERM